MSSSGQPPKPPKNFNLNSKTIAAPLAAFTMACLLFVYARTSIVAAKRNAQSHRDADGGQISWRNESLRRHGRLDAPATSDNGVAGVVQQLYHEGRLAKTADVGVDASADRVGGVRRDSDEERRIRERALGGGRRD